MKPGKTMHVLIRTLIVIAFIGLSLGTLAYSLRGPDGEGGIVQPQPISEGADESRGSHAKPVGESIPDAGSTADRSDAAGSVGIEFGPEVTEEQRAGVKRNFALRMKKLAESTKGFRMIMHRVMAGEPDDSGWRLAHSTRGGFSVRAPTFFSDYTVSTLGQDGVGIQTDWIMAVDHRGVKFTVIASKRGDGKVETLVDPDGLAKIRPGDKAEVHPIKVDGMEGTEARVEGLHSSALMRIFQSNTTSYMVVAEGFRPVGLADFEEEGWRFLRSFRLDRTPPASEAPEGAIDPAGSRDDAP